MTKDELAQKIAAHMRAAEGAHIAQGLTLLAAREGFARVALAVSPDMLNGHGTTHGGVIFTLADTAFAYACNSRNESSVASHAAISFLSPGRAGETLIAEATEQVVQGRSGVCNVTVTGGDGRIVAIFQGLSRTIGGQVLPAEEID